MTISELQRTARDGQRFYAYALNGLRYLCEWESVGRDLFVILECNGKPLKNPARCNAKGAPDARAEMMGEGRSVSGGLED